MTAEVKWKLRTAATWAVILLTAAALVLAVFRLPDWRRNRENRMALRTHWEEVLRFNEETGSAMLWAFDYADIFAEDNSWESLLKARAACTAAMVHLQQMSVPEFTLTEEQYNALADAGIEVDVVEVEYGNLPNTLSQRLVTLGNLNNMLTDDIFLTANADKLPDWIASSRETLQITNAYLCITTNYLQVQMGRKDIWEGLPEKYPHLSESMGEWRGSTEQLMADCDAVLDRLEAQADSAAEYVGISEYTLKVVQETVESGNLERLAARIHEPEGVPAHYPVPQWLGTDTFRFYLVKEPETAELRMVSAGEAIQAVPTACYIFSEGVSREAVDAYAQTLEQWNLEPYCTWDEEARKQQVLVTGESGSLLVEWSQEQTVICLTEPVGCLLPELYLMAMSME